VTATPSAFYICIPALHGVAQLTLKEIHHNALVSLQITTPGFESTALKIPIQIVYFNILYKFLFAHPIQIFVKAIKKEHYQLVGVLLVIAGKLGCEFATNANVNANANVNVNVNANANVSMLSILPI